MHIGINAGNGINFTTHVYAKGYSDEDVINVTEITSSRVPDTVVADGMQIYRVDGSNDPNG